MALKLEPESVGKGPDSEAAPGIAALAFISSLTIRDYLFGTETLARRYQNAFLERYGKEVNGAVVELGGCRVQNHARFFPNAASYTVSNLETDCDEVVDITAMPYADGSQNAYVCVSVLEHVRDIEAAMREIDRTLKPGGKLLLASPFAYPLHGEGDYWRPSRDLYLHWLSGYDIKALVHFGGTVSTIIDALQRPKDKWRGRYLLNKLAGLFLLLTMKFLDTRDGLPLMFGVYAVKR